MATRRWGAPRPITALLALMLPVGALAGVVGALALEGTAGAVTAPIVLHVAPAGTTTGACTTAAHPCGTLGYALSKATSGATVELAAGTYKESSDPSGTSNTVTTSVSIQGVATHPATVVVTASGEQYGLVVSSSGAALTDVTIENAGRSGLLVAPASSATAPATVADVTVLSNRIVTNDKCATTSAFNNANASTICKTPTPLSDFGEGLHLMSVSHSTIQANYVSKNWGGILLTDEVGPSFTNVIAGNTVVTNAGDCGITLAGHNAGAVHTGGATVGKPDPTVGGIYGNTIKSNTVDNNGAAGMLAATPFPGGAVYTNTFETNTAIGNGLAGLTVHSHAPLQDLRGNKILGNTFSNDSLHGGPGHTAGTATAQVAQTMGVEIFAAVATDVTGTVIAGNTITTVFYGVWLSAGVAAVTTTRPNTVTVSSGGTAVFSEPAAVARVAGKTADATAAAELTRAFPDTKGVCPPTRAAVVATTATYQDALSSQYLAQSLTTGTLLTPTKSLSAITATTLRDEGITTVYLVGGTLAIASTVQDAIASLTAYECGGTTRGASTGKISVHRLYGATAYGTAEAVAEHVGITAAADKSFAGAYATTNAAGGTGRFNDTAAKGTAAPSGAVPTAILASGQEFQDAQAASVISYHTKLPMLLTPTTRASAKSAHPGLT